MNNNIGAVFSYSSSTTSSPAAVNSSYFSLNMMNNNHSNNEQMGLSDQALREHEASGDHVVADDGGVNQLNMTSKKINMKKGEKKIRKPKHAFQTRSQVDILDDGYRWRKYGQKAVKNNRFPRNYYRCTHQGCHVKKQVQRLSNDDGVVVTTYEGVHSHPIEKSTDNFENILTQMQIYSR